MTTDILLTIIAAELFYMIVKDMPWYRAIVRNTPHEIRQAWSKFRGK